MDRAIRVLIAPLLLAQGMLVRARALPLPEALGPHSGCTGDGPDLRLLLVGDSSMAGVGVTHLQDALPGQLLTHLTPHYRVHWHMHARSGATTASTSRTLPPHPCDVAVVALGVNDLTSGVPLRRWLAQVEALVDRLVGCGASQVHLSALPPMARFPALPQPLAWVAGAQAARMTKGLRSLEKQRPEVTVHTLPDQALGTGVIAADGFHPGPKAYALWATLIADTILNKLGIHPAGPK